jgi:hypothetical protein
MRGADAKAGVIRRKQGMGLLEGVRSQTAQDLKDAIIGYADAKLDARSTSAGNSGSTETRSPATLSSGPSGSPTTSATTGGWNGWRDDRGLLAPLGLCRGFAGINSICGLAIEPQRK